MNRREFLLISSAAVFGMSAVETSARAVPASPSTSMKSTADKSSDNRRIVTLFLCGDVMTGRGIDQVLPQPSDPRLYEAYVKTASRYVEIAELANGPIPKPVDFSYIWGDALDELERVAPDVRIINLETAITTSDDYWNGKGIHYRMHPANIPCITAAKIDCCVLSNNHVLDWGHSGLMETLETLARVKVKSAGAGRNVAEAGEPAVIELGVNGRVLVFAFGSETSGIPGSWRATTRKSGVNFLKDLSVEAVRRIAAKVKKAKRQGDIVVVSIHWGENWGYEIPDEQTAFAHKLLEEAGVNVIHGHSSHHAKGIEVYRDKPILYGCGDFLSDYEGIGGYEGFRDDLPLMYFVSIDSLTGKLVRLEMTPLQIKRFRLNRVSRKNAQWLRDTLNRQCASFGMRLELSEANRFTLHWVKSTG